MDLCVVNAAKMKKKAARVYKKPGLEARNASNNVQEFEESEESKLEGGIFQTGLDSAADTAHTKITSWSPRPSRASTSSVSLSKVRRLIPIY